MRFLGLYHFDIIIVIVLVKELGKSVLFWIIRNGKVSDLNGSEERYYKDKTGSIGITNRKQR